MPMARQICGLFALLRQNPSRIGIPSRGKSIRFSGVDHCPRGVVNAAVICLRDQGAREIREIDFTPLYGPCRIAHEGAWVSEKRYTCPDLCNKEPEPSYPLPRQVHLQGRKASLPRYAFAGDRRKRASRIC